MLLEVEAGALTGIVQIRVEGKTSNALPFIVTPPANYSASCLAGLSQSQIQINRSIRPDRVLAEEIPLNRA
jgi:hypothetical protein